jgi:ATP-binding cassette subfamily B (MDR/TAP) protein 1
VPVKDFVALGLVVCIISGAMTPLFSFLLSRLLFEVSVSAVNPRKISKFGVTVLSVAAGDGFFIGLKYFIMKTAAMAWVNLMRKRCFRSDPGPG